MSTTDGLTGYSTTHLKGGQGPHCGVSRFSGAAIEMSGTLTLSLGYANLLRIDAGGSARQLNLPAEATSNGAWFEILNTGGETITIKDDGGSTIVSLATLEKVTVVCDGTSWVHMGIITVALS